MKKLLVSLLSGLCLAIVSINAVAISNQIDIRLLVFHYIEEEEEEPPSKGYRTPAAPVICTIDFENHSIKTSISYNITVYELWDEDGDSPIVSYASDYELVEYMAKASGVFQFRIVTTERIYVGYIDL